MFNYTDTDTLLETLKNASDKIRKYNNLPRYTYSNSNSILIINEGKATVMQDNKDGIKVISPEQQALNKEKERKQSNDKIIRSLKKGGSNHANPFTQPNQKQVTTTEAKFADVISITAFKERKNASSN